MPSRRVAKLAVGIIIAGAITTACVMWAASQTNRAPDYYSVRVIRSFPHDRDAYTQGLLFDGDRLIEGTGRYGTSTIREVDLRSGRVVKQFDLPADMFGEGTAIADGRLLQLTWKSRVAIEYNAKTLEPTGRKFHYTGEGWGLTHDGKKWIMSDGTSVLRFFDTKTFEEIGNVSVTHLGDRVLNLNELEFIDGQVFANIWKKDTIVRIDPDNGRVTGVIDVRGVYRSRYRGYEEVLNGIAYHAKDKKLYITGKNWPRLYEIELIAKKGGR